MENSFKTSTTACKKVINPDNLIQITKTGDNRDRAHPAAFNCIEELPVLARAPSNDDLKRFNSNSSSHTLPRRNKTREFTQGVESIETFHDSNPSNQHFSKTRMVLGESNGDHNLVNEPADIKVAIATLGDYTSVTSSSVSPCSSSWSNAERHYEAIEDLKEVINKKDAPNTSCEGNKKVESGESDPGYESDSAKKIGQHFGTLKNFQIFSSSKLQAIVENNPSVADHPGNKPDLTLDQNNGTSCMQSGSEEELNEVEEVTSHIQELENSLAGEQEVDVSSPRDSPVTMEIFSPVLVGPSNSFFEP